MPAPKSYFCRQIKTRIWNKGQVGAEAQWGGFRLLLCELRPGEPQHPSSRSPFILSAPGLASLSVHRPFPFNVHTGSSAASKGPERASGRDFSRFSLLPDWKPCRTGMRWFERCARLMSAKPPQSTPTMCGYSIWGGIPACPVPCPALRKEGEEVLRQITVTVQNVKKNIPILIQPTNI